MSDSENLDRGDLLPPDPVVEEPKVDEVEAAKAEDAEQPQGDTEQDTKAEETTEAEAEAEAEEQAKPKKAKQTASERIQELISKNKAREAEYQAKIRELEEQQARGKLAEDVEAAESKLSEMEVKYAQLLQDGEVKEAAKLRAEMRQLERAIYNQQVKAESQQAKEAAKEEIRYDSTLSALEAAYPQINPDADEYDEEAVGEILALHKGLVSQGLPPSMAVQRAVKYVLGSPPAAESAPVGQEKGLQRIRDAKAKNAEAVKKQPPSTSKVGADSDKMGGGLNSESVLKMGYDDFSKLSEETLAKMRGDYVA